MVKIIAEVSTRTITSSSSEAGTDYLHDAQEIVQQTQNNRSNSNSSSSSSGGRKRSDGDDAIFANVLSLGFFRTRHTWCTICWRESCFIVETGIHAEEFVFSSSKSGKEVNRATSDMQKIQCHLRRALKILVELKR